ncbi:hypothetical protein Tco_0284937 [Tanacetum coccineum]
MVVIGLIEVIGAKVLEALKENIIVMVASDSEDSDQMEKDATCLMAIGSQKVNLNPSHFDKCGRSRSSLNEVATSSCCRGWSRQKRGHVAFILDQEMV